MAEAESPSNALEDVTFGSVRRLSRNVIQETDRM
jgi:hypothetical protein